jgi:hypothetical protein
MEINYSFLYIFLLVLIKNGAKTYEKGKKSDDFGLLLNNITKLFFYSFHVFSCPGIDADKLAFIYK